VSGRRNADDWRPACQHRENCCQSTRSTEHGAQRSGRYHWIRRPSSTLPSTPKSSIVSVPDLIVWALFLPYFAFSFFPFAVFFFDSIFSQSVSERLTALEQHENLVELNFSS